MVVLPNNDSTTESKNQKSVMIAINSMTSTSLFCKVFHGPAIFEYTSKKHKILFTIKYTQTVARMINKAIAKLMFFHNVKEDRKEEGWKV